MPQDFTPRLNVLPPAQRRLWLELAAIPPEFVLYGGTGLVLHLGHRQSEDFDFFGVAPFNPMELAAKLPFLSSATISQRTATHEDMRVLRGYVSDDDFREALDKAPPGIIDPRSWAYWNSKFGRYPPPPRPRRRF
jgi:hypothetical protein